MSSVQTQQKYSKSAASYKPGPKSRKHISNSTNKKLDLKIKPFSSLVNSSNQSISDSVDSKVRFGDRKVDFKALDLTKLKATGEIDTFVGDVSLGERQLLFSLWQLWNKQIGPLSVVQCPQCNKSFSGRSQLSRHLSTSCTDLFEEFFAQLEDYFSSKLTHISSEWNLMNAFEFLKEKMLAFMEQRWCLLCGKTSPKDVWSPTNTGSFLTNHMIHAHFQMDFALYSQPSDGKILNCPLPSKNNVGQKCGFQCKAQGVLFEHLGIEHSLVDDLLNTTVDINTINGTAPLLEDAPTGSDFIKCTKCGKCFANNISLKIHMVTEQKDLVKFLKDSNKLKCGHKTCTHMAKFSDEEISRHFGLVHLDLTSEKTTPKVFQCTPKTMAQNSQIVPFIAPLEPAEDDEIIEITSPKKVYQIIDVDDIDIDDPEEVSMQKLPSKNRIIPAKPKTNRIPASKDPHSIGFAKNCIDWTNLRTNLSKPAKVTNHVTTTPTPSSLLVKQYSSVPVDVKCPVCNVSFGLVTLLHQHLAIKHFRGKLAAMVSPGRNGVFTCPDPHCSFAHRTTHVITLHMSTNHLMAFDVAKKMFPEFSIPAPSTGSSVSSSNPMPVSHGRKRHFTEVTSRNVAKRLKGALLS